MRRVCAALLLSLFSFSLIGPALFADGNSKLPACCRKDGKHHCSMANMEEQGSDAAIKSAGSKCPLFPAGGVFPASGKIAATHPARLIFAAVASHSASHAQREAQYRVSFSRAWQKRGPPDLLS
jgi:hypothetical protein